MFEIPCVIFAGGKSSRMGEDKSLLPFGEFSTLTEYQHSKLSKLFKNVYISTKDTNKFSFSANFISDISQEEISYAPTNGFVAAFETLGAEKIFVISVDAPFISEDIIKELINTDKKTDDATIAKTARGIEPMCGVYHISLLDAFIQMQKNNSHKLGQLLKNSKTNYIMFCDEKAFLNLNNPHEYQEALILLDS